MTVEHMHEPSPGEVEKNEANDATPSSDNESTPKTAFPEEIYPESNLEQGVVAWDGQNDPQNPRNFGTVRKSAQLIIITMLTLLSSLASSMFAPAASFMAEDLGETNKVLVSFTVSVFVLGYAFGPLLLAPLSEFHGRRIVLSVSNAFFVVWQIGCALAPNIESLIIFRFFAGIGGSGSITVVPGVIADLFDVHHRGMAMSGWALGVLFGPILGPICGGFIGQQLGWRWVYWILLIASGVTAVINEVVTAETRPQVLLRWKTRRLRSTLNRPDLRSFYDTAGPDRPSAKMSGTDLIRPLVLLFKSPILFVFATYMSYIYGLLYLFFTTIPGVFQGTYGWSPQISGLAYLGLAIGFFLGLALTASTSDKAVIRLANRNNGKVEPEMRLPGMVFFGCLVPVAFFWYGWSTYFKAHWIVSIIGMVPFAVGLNGVFLATQLYVVDCFTTYAASAVGTLTATRSLVGALLPLAGDPLFTNLGLGWGNSLLGFLALACVPIPLLLLKYGKLIREKYPVTEQV